MDNLQLIDFSKEDDCLLAVPFRDDTVEDVRLSCAAFAVGFDNEAMIKRDEMGPVERRRLSELRKSLDWNSAFFTSQGLLNPEELSKINKVYKKASRSCQPSFSSQKHVNPDIRKPSKVPIDIHGLAPNQVVMEHRTRKAGAGFTLSGRSQGELSSKLTSFTTPKTKKSKVHRSNESLSNTSSKCITRNIKLRNIKPIIVDPSSVLSPLSSTCSSSTSPCTSFHNATSPSDFQTPRCDATRPSMRKIKCLGLRIPYPNIDPFDEAQAVIKGSMHKLNQIEASTLVTDIEKKQDASDQCLLQESQKEDMCCYEDEVNGLTSHLESIGLDRHAEVKSKRSCPKCAQPFLETSRPSLSRRSLDWDSAFVTSAGLLNNEEMTAINKGFAEANSNQPSYGTQKHGRHQVSGQNQILSYNDGFQMETLESDLPECVNAAIHNKNKAKKRLKEDIASDHSKVMIDKDKRKDSCKSQEESRTLSFLRKSLDWDSAFIPSAGLLNFEELSLINRGFKEAGPIQSIPRARKHIQTHIGSHQDQTCSKSDDLPLGSLEADLFKDVKPDIHKVTKECNPCKASSFTSSATENTPKVHQSVESPSSGSSKLTRRKINYRNTKMTTISSGTSPASHFHDSIWESDFLFPPYLPCRNFGERNFTKQYSTRLSIGNIMPSGLRKPSPKIGFFDEEQPLQLNIKERMQIYNEFQSLERRLSFLNKAYGMVPSSLVQVC